MIARIRDSATIVCPHCGHRHTDPNEMCPDDKERSIVCDECGKTFLAVADFDVSYVSYLPKGIE